MKNVKRRKIDAALSTEPIITLTLLFTDRCFECWRAFGELNGDVKRPELVTFTVHVAVSLYRQTHAAQEMGE